MHDISDSCSNGADILEYRAIASEIGEWIKIGPSPVHMRQMSRITGNKSDGLAEDGNKKAQCYKTYPGFVDFFGVVVVALEHALLEKHFFAYRTCVFARVDPVEDILVAEDVAAREFCG